MEMSIVPFLWRCDGASKGELCASLNLFEEEKVMTEEIMEAVSGQVFGVWFLIGAALVFWMQAGFAMVETGFTRAKNAGNILMKNLKIWMKTMRRRYTAD